MKYFAVIASVLAVAIASPVRPLPALVETSGATTPLVQIIVNVKQTEQVTDGPSLLPAPVINPEINPTPVIVVDNPVEINPTPVIVVDKPDVINPTPVIVVDKPAVNPVDDVQILPIPVEVQPVPVNPIDVIAVAAPDVNPVDIINPVPVNPAGEVGSIFV